MERYARTGRDPGRPVCGAQDGGLCAGRTSAAGDARDSVYLEGLRTVFGRDFDFCFLAFEKAEPYGVALYGAPEEMIKRGERRLREALARLKACRETGSRPHGDYKVLVWPRDAK